MISSQKFINNKHDVVTEALDGLLMLNSNKLIRYKNTQIIQLKDPNPDQISLICGGGSGHEPAHAGFVEKNMLTSAICGGVFASPSHKEILQGILSVPNKHGVLLIIKQYTGDVINFELAASLARAQGIKVETIHVGEDAAFEQDKRGLAGTVVLYKILGGLVSQFKWQNLQKIKEFGEKVIQNIKTVGCGLGGCSLPGQNANFSVDPGYVEIGLGIHGEKGVSLIKFDSAKKLIQDLLGYFNFQKDYQQNNEVLVVLNNLGSTTELELMILIKEILEQMKEKKINVKRVVCGKIMSSLEMHGISLTILNIFDPLIVEVLDLQVENPFWVIFKNFSFEIKKMYREISFDDFQKIDTKVVYESPFHCLMEKIFTHLISKENLFNKLDAQVGDGDTGTGVTRASLACLSILKHLNFEKEAKKCFARLGEEIAGAFGGTCGPLYGVFLSSASLCLKDELKMNGKEEFLNGLKKDQIKLNLQEKLKKEIGLWWICQNLLKKIFRKKQITK
ncbi:hypothetical protein IMG5_191210 [Ichthyophthirius multifiliis]|uniref:Glycerone kinase n=1 Tax=Ichthyophthirius multifiliis TaxID=5932 RepID=G0R4C6_ICHMU|nr:hypothetical protein IMG5_191210 [Ichthyophthirius multifiliis]EGR27676.1 hypothetical protein IMG5_191210 [Ichthyophthirius multifiliis]|eukprot:XP_004025128.1 hypothetical protein IMG5_191210 [Ichthyophthirius multifiliis]